MTLETKLLKKEAEYEHELSTLKQQAENSRKNLEQEVNVWPYALSFQ